ncbi:sugar phosphate isomerase/epimerase family protein [Dokdonia sp. Hel_I_53]|uniref:sugar phosphate isomerase/epimerase family protein n=1 Tax=Dokdonia sp. Hel_I_53 TaxID=1566287 RepID=UPI00119BC7BC|nr:sugar phosphate isomerase/epimerase family protein [Dokdonia sp. Hel_I_53]TVZ52757.1 sugar phosphate isomerase/epimerase [Dokdonia sp. Hel_I_53]
MKNFIIGSIIVFLGFISCKNEVKIKDENAFAKAEKEEVASTAMNIQHSLAQWSLHKPFLDGTLDPLNFPAIARDLGFSGVEYVTQLYPSVQSVGPNYREDVMKLATTLSKNAKQAEVESVLLMVDNAGELADPDPEKLAAAIENHKIWMDAAKVMGAHSIRANLFGELDPEQWHKISVASLKELGAYGEELGVNILIENHGGWSSDATKLVAVMEEVNMPTVGTLPDFGNFCIKREGGARWGAPCIETYDTYKGIKQLMPYAKGVSAKSYEFDNDGNETTLDYQQLMQIVKDSGFEGYVGTEYEGSLDDPMEGVKLTKALVENSIENLK